MPAAVAYRVLMFTNVLYRSGTHLGPTSVTRAYTAVDHVQRIVRSARIGGLKSEPPLSHVCWQLSSIERVAAGWMMTSATSHEAQDDALWHRARSANRSATSSDSELMILKTDCSVPSTVREDVRTQPTLVAATLDAVAGRGQRPHASNRSAKECLVRHGCRLESCFKSSD